MTASDIRLREPEPPVPATMAEARAMARPPKGLSGWKRTFSALSERDYAVYFAGNLAFFMAMQMNQLLRGYLAFDLTDSAAALGIVAMAMALPMLFVSPFGGVIADRYNKRTLLLLTQGMVTAVNAVMTVLIIADLVEFWHVAASSIFLGLTISLAMPARNALVPQLIPQHKMMNAISLQMGGMNLTRIIGPAIGGLLIAPLGLGVVWGFSVVLYLIATFSILALPIHGMVAKQSNDRFMREMSEGFRYIAGAPMIRMLILTGMVMPLFAFPVQLVLPVFQKDVFDLGPWALGVMMGAAGFGGLVGALIAANLDEMPAKGRLMLIGAIVQGGFFVAFALTPFFGAAIAFLVLGNIGGMLFMTTNNSVIQAEVPERYRGRVMSMLMMSFGMMPLGVLPLTLMSDAFGAPTAVAASSSLMVGVLLLIFMFSSQLRGLRVVPSRHAEMSPSQAAALVASGKISREEAARLTGVSLEDLPATAPSRVPLSAAAGANGAGGNGAGRRGT